MSMLIMLDVHRHHIHIYFQFQITNISDAMFVPIPSARPSPTLWHSRGRVCRALLQCHSPLSLSPADGSSRRGVRTDSLPRGGQSYRIENSRILDSIFSLKLIPERTFKETKSSQMILKSLVDTTACVCGRHCSSIRCTRADGGTSEAHFKHSGLGAVYRNG